MKEQYFHQKNFIPLAQAFEKPIHDILELNVKTLQGMSYVTPLEFLNVTKPEQILEKNVNVLIQNSHQALNYMFNVFNIMEKHLFSLSEKVTEQSKDFISATNLTDSGMQSLLKRTTSSAKSSVKKAVKQVKSAVSKSASKNVVSKSVPKSSVSKSASKNTLGKSISKSAPSKSVPKRSMSKSVSKSAVSKSVPKSSVSKSVTKAAVSKSVPKSPVSKSVSKSSFQPAKQEQAKLQQQAVAKTQPVNPVSNPFNFKLAQQSISENNKPQNSSVTTKPEVKNPDTKLIK